MYRSRILVSIPAVLAAVIVPAIAVYLLMGVPGSILPTGTWVALTILAVVAMANQVFQYYCIGLTNRRLVVLLVSGWPHVKWARAIELCSFERTAIAPVKLVSTRLGHDVRIEVRGGLRFSLRRIGPGAERNEAISTALLDMSYCGEHLGTQLTRRCQGNDHHC